MLKNPGNFELPGFHFYSLMIYAFTAALTFVGGST